MDRTKVSGTFDAGSIPAGSTLHSLEVTSGSLRVNFFDAVAEELKIKPELQKYMTVELLPDVRITTETPIEQKFGPVVTSFSLASHPEDRFLVRQMIIPGEANDTSTCVFRVYDAHNEEQGRIIGELGENAGKRVFKSMRADNYGRGMAHQMRHLISTAIAELVIQGSVDEWLSACELEEGGKRMYERLSQNPDLCVTSVPDGNVSCCNCYKLIRAI